MKINYRKSDGRPFVMKKGPKLFSGNDDTKNLGYKESEILKELSLEFTGTDASGLVYDTRAEKSKVWFLKNGGKSTLYQSTPFKGKDGLEYIAFFMDTENSKGKTIAVGLKNAADISKWKEKGHMKENQIIVKEEFQIPGTNIILEEGDRISLTEAM
jgi:hypothetical protein